MFNVFQMFGNVKLVEQTQIGNVKNQKLIDDEVNLIAFNNITYFLCVGLLVNEVTFQLFK